MVKPRMPQPMGPNGPITLPTPPLPTKMKYVKPAAEPLMPSKKISLPGQKSVPHPEPTFPSVVPTPNSSPRKPKPGVV